MAMDPELLAMQHIERELRALGDEDARRRVIAWAADRVGLRVDVNDETLGA